MGLLMVAAEKNRSTPSVQIVCFDFHPRDLCVCVWLTVKTVKTDTGRTPYANLVCINAELF